MPQLLEKDGAHLSAIGLIMSNVPILPCYNSDAALLCVVYFGVL